MVGTSNQSVPEMASELLTRTAPFLWSLSTIRPRSVSTLSQYLPDSASGHIAVAEVFRLIDQAEMAGAEALIQWDPVGNMAVLRWISQKIPSGSIW